MGGACSVYGEEESVQRVLVGKPEEKNHLGGPRADVRIILRCMFRSGMWGYGLGRAGTG